MKVLDQTKKFIEENKSRKFDIIQIDQFIADMIEAVPDQSVDFYTNLLCQFNTRFYIAKEKTVSRKIESIDASGNKTVTTIQEDVPVQQHINLAYYYGGNGTTSKRPLQLLIEKILSEKLDFSKYQKVFPHKENTKKYLKACKKLFANANGLKIGEAATSFARYIENIYYNMNHPEAQHREVMLYLFSALGGTGKSEFQKKLIHFFKTYKLPVAEHADLRTRWQDGKYATNIATFVSEFFPVKSNEEASIVLLNNIIDNTIYEVEGKGRDPIGMQSHTTLCCGSNRRPYDGNTRRYALVEMNEFRLLNAQKFNAEDQKLLHTEYTPDDWDKVLFDAFTSCPFGTEFLDYRPSLDETYQEMILNVRQFVNSIDAMSGNYDNMTVSDFARYMYMSQTGGKYNIQEVKFLKKSLLNMVYYFVNKGMLKPSQKVNGSVQYSKYNWIEIANIQTEDDEDQSTPAEILAEDNLLKRTALAWDYLISEVDPDEPTDGNDPDPTTDNDPEDESETTDPIVDSVKDACQKLEAESGKFTGPTDVVDLTDADLQKLHLFTTTDIYSAPECKVSPDTQYLVTATPKTEYLQEIMKTGEAPDRKGAHYNPVFFVYEIDDTSLETQAKIAEAVYKKNIFSITDSAHKSLHILVKIDPAQAEQIGNDNKYYWRYTAEKLFGKEVASHFDEHCSDTTRLSRFPNGIRNGDTKHPECNGRKQTCLYLNKDCEPIDLKKAIDDHYDDEMEKLIERYAVMYKARSTRYDNSDPDTVEHLKAAVNKSHNESGQIAVQLIDGYDPGSGQNYIGAIRYAELLCGPKTAALVRSLAHKLHPTNIGK